MLPLLSQVWWHTHLNPALGRLRQEDCKFKASLGCIVRPCLKNKTNFYRFLAYNSVVLSKKRILKIRREK
jgi:hypothetical protein